MEKKPPVLSEAEVYPHTLPSDQKRIFWEGLKVLRPGLVELYNEDEFIKGAMTRWSAVPVFKKSEADEIYKAGLTAFENLKGNEQ